MKKVAVFLLLITTLSSFSSVSQNTERWKKVEEFAKKQLPESAMKEVETILQNAQQNGNFSETLKAYIYKMRFTLDKNPEEASKVIKDFENFSASYKSMDEKALLHSMVAELYAMYYMNYRYTIDQRTQIEGFIPEDIKEWSKNIFFTKITDEIGLSLENSAILQRVDLSKFEALIEKGKNSEQYQPTLYDFLAQRGINILQSVSSTATIKNPLNDPLYLSPVNQFIQIKLEETYAQSAENHILKIYQNLLAFRQKENNSPAFIFIDLARLDYIRQTTENINGDELYLQALLNLQSQYENNEVVIDVLEKIADFYVSESYSSNEDELSYKKMAYDTAEKGISKFPNAKRINSLKNIQAQITQKSISINYPAVSKPQTEIAIKINSANINNLVIRIYRINATAKDYYLYKQNNRNSEKKNYPNRTLIQTKNISVKADENYGNVETEITINTDTYGIYEFTVAEKNSTKKSEQADGVITVTDFAYIQRRTDQNATNFYVVDRRSGNTIENINVAIANYNWDGKNYVLKGEITTTTDKNGAFISPTKQYNYIYYFEKGNDKYFSSQSNSYYQREQKKETDSQLSLFTDRSLYRPGQTVYFKGIAFSSQNQQVIRNTDYEVKLLDVNYQEVSKKTFKTNEFGSFSGEFVLPESGLNGAYYIESGYNSTLTFYVEEYKRPTFEVKINKPDTEINFGQNVTLKGNVKAYAGYNVANAQVKYTITRRTHRLYWWLNMSERIISDGTTISDENGNFEVSFTPEKIKQRNSLLRDQFYTYSVRTEVTDTRGETQQGIQTVSVGDKSLIIVSEVNERYDKQDELSIKLHTETLNGKKIPSIINYTIYKLEEGSTYREKISDILKLNESRQVMSGIFNTDDKTLKLNLSNQASGYYKIVFKGSDTQGREITNESAFILYDKTDTLPPVKSYIWLLTPKTKVSVGENAEIRFGTSTKNVSVLYEIMKGNTILESRWITLNNEIRTFEIPFISAYEDGVNVIFTFVKDEQLFTRSVQITKKTENKNLTPSLSVFRDKLQPGEEAEWTVTIPEADSDNMVTELMIGMYDASLDAIRPHNWIFNPSYSLNIPYSPAWNAGGFNKGYASGYYEIDTKKVEGISLDNINWFGLEIANPIIVRDYRSISRKMFTGSAAVIQDDAASKLELVYMKEDSANALAENEVVNQEQRAAGLADEVPVPIRSNFNETAFFYPQLKTDQNGNIKFSFKVPESLTRWNVKMIAHTPDLYFGQSEAQVVTQKDLMVQLNMPRFVRNSDKLTLVANVINMTDNTFTARVNLELINPENNQLIRINDTFKEITLAANETKAMEWNITEFSGYELVTVKVTAQAGTFSDGEQHYLPILPDKVLITESLPLTIRGNETRKFTFDSFINQMKNVDSRNLTVEFSSNPTWYAIQALPTLSSPENENAIDYFTAFYANGLASYIANSNPRIAAVFDQWKRQGGSREALLSNLEKNTELKNMLLEETPWVLNAKDETEQKRQIALLFDLNQQKNQGQQYLDKLIELQKSSGGFAWFDGMSENRYITQTILLNMARYNEMTNFSGDQPEWIKKALNYLDLEISRDFDNVKKTVKDYQTEMVISDIQLFYLHLRSYYKDIPVSESARIAVDFYTSQAEKYWTECTLYGKAATALIMHRNGKTTLPVEILNSLKENAMKTDELGMYWVRNTAGYFWNERPVSVQTAIMEAFTEITKSQSDIDEMKIWLLKQRQTQRWDSPISTVDAIYTLLNYGTDWLESEGNVQIKLGNKKLEPQTKEAGTGYFKVTIDAENLSSKMGNVTVTKSDAGIGWGSMYWQYFQDVDKIQQHGGALSVTKKLFVEKTANNTVSMIPVEQAEIKKGDKVIVRLVVTTDRNLEFVALKDLRASGLEPVEQRSGMIWREGVSYYQTTKDASTQFFLNFLPTGTYVFEYECWANNTGDFANGMATIQCQYAPEFLSHSSSNRIIIK